MTKDYAAYMSIYPPRVTVIGELTRTLTFFQTEMCPPHRFLVEGSDGGTPVRTRGVPNEVIPIVSVYDFTFYGY
jgi:hypothetical protein